MTFGRPTAASSAALPPRKGTPGREATVVLRLVRVVLAAPARDRANRGRSVAVSVVEDVERRAPKGCEPLRRVPLSTFTAGTFEQAQQAVQWYRWRWLTERFYALIKGA